MDRFIRWFSRMSAALGVVGVASVVIPGGNRLLGACALALAALLIVMVGLVALIDLEERERGLAEPPLPDPPLPDPPRPIRLRPIQRSMSCSACPQRPGRGGRAWWESSTIGRPPRTPWSREGDELVARLALAPGRTYRYRYLLDGDRWENDWNADAYVPNGFGGEDSVLDLTATTPPLGELVT